MLFRALTARALPLELLLAGISGAMCIASFPRTNMWPLAWICLIPLFFSLKFTNRKRSFIVGGFFGFIYATGIAYWIFIALNTNGNAGFVTSFVFILLVVGGGGAVYFGIYAFGWHEIMRILPRGIPRATAVACWWVVIEYGRAHLLTGFPWGLLGHSQYNWLHLIQIADITGVYGVSFLLVLVNVILFETLGRRPDLNSAFSIMYVSLLLTVTLAYGAIRLYEIETTVNSSGQGKTVAVIQGSISQTAKWKTENQQRIIDRYLLYSEKALRMGAEMIVWPETVVPIYLQNKVPSEITDLLEKYHATLILGGPRYAGTPPNYMFYNSAYQITPQKIKNVYDKIHLLPFGEYFPFGFIDILKTRYAGPREYAPGEKNTIFTSPAGEFGTLICFEGIFPERAKALAAHGAEFFINISNDAWFGRSSAHLQHFSIFVFRAIEFRRQVMRSSNTGISGFIAPTGRIVKTLTPYQEGYLTAAAIPNDTATVYYRYGDLFSLICFLVLLIRFAAHVYVHGRRRWPTKLQAVSN